MKRSLDWASPTINSNHRNTPANIIPSSETSHDDECLPRQTNKDNKHGPHKNNIQSRSDSKSIAFSDDHSNSDISNNEKTEANFVHAGYELLSILQDALQQQQQHQHQQQQKEEEDATNNSRGIISLNAATTRIITSSGSSTCEEDINPRTSSFGKTLRSLQSHNNNNHFEGISTCWVQHVRDWLLEHPLGEERIAAATCTTSTKGCNSSGTSIVPEDSLGKCTPLHLICMLKHPPIDIVKLFIECAPETLAWTDSRGCIPLHYACLNDTLFVDRAMIIQALMYHTNQDHVKIQEREGCTPLHLAMAKANLDNSFIVIRLLLHKCVSAVTILDNNNKYPLQCVPSKDIQRESVQARSNMIKCLTAYFDSHPPVIPRLLPVIKMTLYSYIRQEIMIHPYLKKVLALKSAEEFPTYILISDIGYLIVIVVFFQIEINSCIEILFNNNWVEVNNIFLIWLYLPSGYFLVREILQMISGASIKQYMSDLKNWIDLAVIGNLFFWIAQIHCVQVSGDVFLISKETFRSGVAITTAILYFYLVLNLQSALVDFAVFGEGVRYVVSKLPPFLFVLFLSLLGFSEMFLRVHQGTSHCNDCVDRQECMFCQDMSSFFMVISMLAGDVSVDMFSNSTISKWFYVAYILLIFIILLNVLIAIVNDAFTFIKDERAYNVFWTKRFNFLIEAEETLVFLRKLCKLIPGGYRICCSSKDVDYTAAKTIRTTKKSFIDWDTLMNILRGSQNTMCDNWLLNCLLKVIVTIALCLWVCLGIATSGSCLPPQVKYWLWNPRPREEERLKEERLHNYDDTELTFVSGDSLTSSDNERAEELLLLEKKINELRKETHELIQEQTKEIKRMILSHKMSSESSASFNA